ncbi:MAG: 50S ribosomal protein L24 [Negativicutes bacterium]|nr:50S ribosomal protein L24 [Negativicutes bacterium]
MAELKKLHVKKDDKVVLLAGKDKGKEGKIKAAQPKNAKVVVEGVNVVKRHAKPSQKNPQGGIVSKEAPVHVSNVMLVCPSCKKPTRIQKKQLTDGGYARACKKCGELIDKK